MTSEMSSAELGIFWMNRAAGIIVILVLATLMSAVFVAVFFRYIINYSIVWAEELARYLFVWLTFVGTGLGVGKNIHIGVDLLIKRFPIGVQRWVEIGVGFGVIAFAVLLIVFGIKMTAFGMNSRAMIMRIPMGFVYLSVPIGGVIIFGNSLIRIWKLLGEKSEGR